MLFPKNIKAFHP